MLAKEVLVTVSNVKATEDLNLRPIDNTLAAIGTHTLIHAPHKQPNLTCRELIASSV